MGESIRISDGIVSFAKVDFDCPNCKANYGEDFYMKQLQKAKRTYIYKKCTTCGEKIGISTDMRGDTVVWLKKNEDFTEPK